MAKIKLNAASGGGSVSLQAPSSSSSDVILTLPEVADTTVATVNGITMFDQYRLTTSFSGAVDPISSNIERVDTNSPALIGSAMSVSSGIFTFPSTGMYEVCFYLRGTINSGDSRFSTANIMVTTDGTNFNEGAQGANSFYNGGAEVLSSCVAVVYFDVTDTSTHKVKFKVTVNSGSTNTSGSTDRNRTYFTFKKIGDT
tara:strand:- start:333 stop:929 length:597 start_codon:yes stop_codon:yes gene_type:complete